MNGHSSTNLMHFNHCTRVFLGKCRSSCCTVITLDGFSCEGVIWNAMFLLLPEKCMNITQNGKFWQQICFKWRQFGSSFSSQYSVQRKNCWWQAALLQLLSKLSNFTVLLLCGKLLAQHGTWYPIPVSWKTAITDWLLLLLLSFGWHFGRL